jgi:hypothetical protein
VIKRKRVQQDDRPATATGLDSEGSVVDGKGMGWHGEPQWLVFEACFDKNRRRIKEIRQASRYRCNKPLLV